MEADSATGLRGAAPTPRATTVPSIPADRGLTGLWWPAALTVAALTVLGAAIRLAVAHESLFGDELSTYWIIRAHGLGGVISTVHSNDEITPPLYFVLAWLTTRVGHSPELVRAPSLVAGVASIPLTYLLGRRTVGRRAGLVAAALTTLAPFTIYYSTEARAYGLMMALVVGSTLTMLVAVDTRKTRWWIVYAACSCAAAYTHYTCVFVLAAQLLWLLWVHPEARRPAILANVGAVIAFAPWTSGLVNDFTSPTSRILSELSPFTAHDVLVALEHWTVGYPYATIFPPQQVPGTPALVLLGLGLIVAGVGISATALRERAALLLSVPDRRLLLLVVALFASVPVGEAIASAVSTHIFGVRNLAASWPGFALVLSTGLVAAGRRLRTAAVVLVIASFAIGGAKMLQAAYQRPDLRTPAAYIDDHAARGDIVVDGTGVLSPGPLTALDAALKPGHRVFRYLAPTEKDHPFGVFDRLVSPLEATRHAIAAARGRKIFVVAMIPLKATITAYYLSHQRQLRRLLLKHFRLTYSKVYPGSVKTTLEVYVSRQRR